VAEPVSPAERALRADLERGPFQSGVDRGKWRLLLVEWPHVQIAVSASADCGPTEYVLRFECSNYPQSAPTARLWDPERGAPLAPDWWPTGTKRAPLAFNPEWKEGTCLYLPCDRISFVGHEAWRTQHPEMIWSATSEITLYLRIVHELLNSSDYTGPRSA
jgi:hypothetical protein